MSVIYKQQRSLNRVNKILDTAHNVLMDGEINDLSIANLTKVADLKRTSTYKFFPHPDDIKIALIERYINELKEKLENFNVSSSEHHQTLKELINEIYLYFKENISAQKIILANTVNPPVDSAKLQALSNLLVNKIEAANKLPNMFNKEGVFLVITQIIISVLSLNLKENNELNEIGTNEALRASYAYLLSCTTK
ncbi:MAG: TetR/AcrR family transcriptional regulator [Gammaproteobacteria bacterium]